MKKLKPLKNLTRKCTLNFVNYTYFLRLKLETLGINKTATVRTLVQILK